MNLEASNSKDLESGYGKKSRVKVLLREAEECRICGKKYLSLYPLRHCEDHDGLDRAGN